MLENGFQLTPEILREFPTTRFRGSKRKLLPWIYQHLSNLDFKSAVDVFGGSASVSYLFKRMGKAVIYNDAMRWNYLVGTALIENDKHVLSVDEIEELTSAVKDEAPGFVARNFRGVYFTERENLWIDAVIRRISEFVDSRRWHKCKSALAHYALFQTCLSKRPFNLFHRKNLHLRFADVDRSFGNKTTWDKPFGRHMRHFLEEANGCVFESSQKCTATNHRAEELPNFSSELIYLDPPYLKAGRNESSDYARCYHFLEGLSNYDAWHGIVDWSSTQLRPRAGKANPWMDTKESLQEFRNLFDKFSDRIIVISYKKFGIPSVEDIVAELKSIKRRVTVHSKPYKYALNHQNGSAKFNREYLIVAE